MRMKAEKDMRNDFRLVGGKGKTLFSRFVTPKRLDCTEVRFQHSFLSVQVSNVPYCEALRRRSEMDLFFLRKNWCPEYSLTTTHKISFDMYLGFVHLAANVIWAESQR